MALNSSVWEARKSLLLDHMPGVYLPNLCIPLPPSNEVKEDKLPHRSPSLNPALSQHNTATQAFPLLCLSALGRDQFPASPACLQALFLPDNA